jgi:hypothetical protein
MKLAKPLLGAVAAGVLAAGAWAAVPAGAASRPSVTAAPAANAATTAAATTTASTTTAATATAAPVPASPASCETEHWPDRATGQPAGLEAGAPTGFYLWHNDEGWHLEVTHPTHDHVVFSGWISTNGTIDYQRVDDEHTDVVKLGPAEHRLGFAFNNYGYLDGVHFATHCADRLEFHLFINGRPAGVEQVSVGHGSVHPKAMPFIIDRSDVH